MMRCCEDLRIFSLENLFSDTTLRRNLFSLLMMLWTACGWISVGCMCVLIDNFEDVAETTVFVHQYEKVQKSCFLRHA